MTSKVVRVLRRGNKNARCELDNGVVMLISYQEHPDVDVGSAVEVPDNIAPARDFGGRCIIRPWKASDN